MKKFLTISSITKKVTLAIAGSFLLVFLLVHLGINLLLLRSDNGAMYAEAVHFMTTNWVVKLFEIILFGSFLLHAILGVILWLQNLMSRPVRYYVPNTSKTSFFSKYMIYTGALIFTFLVIHFMNFYFVKLGWVSVPEGVYSRHDFYQMAVLLFSNPWYSVLYLILMVNLGLHLSHALQSAIQTFGFNHNKYTKGIKRFSVIYAIVVSSGFALIPIYFLFFS